MAEHDDPDSDRKERLDAWNEMRHLRPSRIAPDAEYGFVRCLNRAIEERRPLTPFEEIMRRSVNYLMRPDSERTEGADIQDVRTSEYLTEILSKFPITMGIGKSIRFPRPFSSLSKADALEMIRTGAIQQLFPWAKGPEDEELLRSGGFPETRPFPFKGDPLSVGIEGWGFREWATVFSLWVYLLARELEFGGPVRSCPTCGRYFIDSSARGNRRACSDRCRVRRHRARSSK